MALVKWTTPKVMRRREWETQGKPLLREFAGYCVKWTLLLSLPALYAVWQFAPFALHRVALSIVCVPLLLVLHAVSPLVSMLYGERRCRADGDGLLYHVGNDNRRVRWHHIQKWSIGDHPKLPGIRVLTIKATRLRRLRTFTFPFNPRVTDEARLRQLLREHVRAS